MVLKKLLFSVMLFSMLVSAQGINCYQCNSEIHPECHDLGAYKPHLTAGLYKECNEYHLYNGTVPFCRKTELSLLLPIKQQRTIRSCGWVKHHIPCYKAENDDHEEISCQCFGDGCNGSNQIKVFSMFAFLIFGAFMLG